MSRFERLDDETMAEVRRLGSVRGSAFDRGKLHAWVLNVVDAGQRAAIERALEFQGLDG